MKKLFAIFVIAAASTALAYPGSVPAGSRIYAQASKSSAVVATLPPKVTLEIVSCNSDWCKVTAQGKTGWLPRPLVKAKYGRCTELSEIGMTDILKSEASYTPGLDRDKDNIGCNTVK